MDFNYVKAWYGYAKPAMENLNFRQKNAISKVYPLIGELNQGRNLDISMTPAIRKILSELTTEELATLSRAIHEYGYWLPSGEKTYFDNRSGENWKISNCCDQLLKERLKLPKEKMDIDKGQIRLLYNIDDEFASDEVCLAVEENVDTVLGITNDNYQDYDDFKYRCGVIKEATGDMWKTDNPPDTEDYQKYLEREKKKNIQKNKENYERRLMELKEKSETAELEFIINQWMLEHDIPIDNLIYYFHTKTFSFGWRSPLPKEEVERITKILKENNFAHLYEFNRR